MFEDLLESLASQGQLVHVEQQPARQSRTALLAEPLPDDVVKRLGINFLWSHQAEALDLVRDGHSVVVATGTASGKSLCYQVPIAEAVGRRRLRVGAAALPHQGPRPGPAAGARDARRSRPRRRDLRRRHRGPEQRAWVRRHANVVLTNPEMLHVGHPPVPRAVGDVPHAASATS